MFDETLYLIEMSRLLRDAADALRRDHRDLVIYSVSIWTDPNAAVSAVSVDTKVNSDAKLTALKTWAYARQAEALAAGDPEMAVLLGTFPPRNRNPADFALRELACVDHRAFSPNWEAGTRGDCWRELGPALQKVRSAALELFGNLPLHAGAELAVNSSTEWYDTPSPLIQQAI